MNLRIILILLFVDILEKQASGQKILWEDDIKSTTVPALNTIQSVDKHFAEGRASDEPVSKQYFTQPYPQYNPYYSYSSPHQQNINGGNNWEWTQFSATTQQSRKPVVQFPGENKYNSVGTIPASSSSSNSRRIPSISTSSGVRIDESCHCGVVPVEKDSHKMQRIVGGTVTKENSWPWMVAITYMGKSKPFWFCGGSLISDKFVLTAAHCLKTIRNFGLSNVKLIMGTNNLLDNQKASYYSIYAVRPHPMYKAGTEDYDMALLEIKEKVNFTSRVSPICLSQVGEPFVNRTVIVAGWGSLQNGEGPPADLREVDLKVVSHDVCEKEYYYNYRTSITSSMLCAWLPGKDSCQGDSGGPLFLKTTKSPFAYTQIGIVSFGPPNCGVTTIPGVYSKISSSIRWVKSIARSGKFCKGTF